MENGDTSSSSCGGEKLILATLRWGGWFSLLALGLGGTETVLPVNCFYCLKFALKYPKICLLICLLMVPLVKYFANG